MTDKPEKKEGLWVPKEFTIVTNLNWGEKMILAHIFSFGTRGCYQCNGTLAKLYGVCDKTISRIVNKLIVDEEIIVKAPRSQYRTLWACSHPQVKAGEPLTYVGKLIRNPLGQKCPSRLGNNGKVTGTKSNQSPPPKCPSTYKGTYKKTITMSSPSPAVGQAKTSTIQNAPIEHVFITCNGKRKILYTRHNPGSKEWFAEQKRRLKA